MKLAQFWRFYHILSQYNFDETQLINSTQLSALQKKIERQRDCSFGCQQKCKDYAGKNNLFDHCDFYKLVVFGDEMIRVQAEKSNRRFAPHALERHFFGSQFGGKDLLLKVNNIRDLKDDKHAPIYYYMLAMGFQDNLTVAEGKEKRDELYGVLRDQFSPKDKEQQPMLSQNLYKDIQPTKAFDVLGSAKAIAIVAVVGIVLIWLVLNAAWFFYTEEIRENLLQVQNLLKLMEK